jgi:hypothetical protein
MKYSTLYGKESVQKLADDGLEQHHVIKSLYRDLVLLVNTICSLQSGVSSWYWQRHECSTADEILPLINPVLADLQIRETKFLSRQQSS